MEYVTVVGLEVHAELNTKTKAFCACKNSFGNEVNTNCCPICAGFPGTLPTLNEKVVDYAIMMGHALHCTINAVCKQDRKHYFYPDLPRAYQISQFDIPLCSEGHLDVILNETGAIKTIGIERIHIEEDAGKLIHDESFSGSLVDLNRSGVPLIEIVSKPDMRSAAEAKAYLESIKSILQCLDISDCKMQEGSIRCDINVSVMPKDAQILGTRVEMKNVNSFSAAVKAIEFESSRQIEIITNGGTIPQETRRWDNLKNKNFILRSKEDAHDYRYFPEPDLKTIVVTEEHIQSLKENLPELPNAKLKRLMDNYGLPYADAGLLVEHKVRCQMFEETVSMGASAKATANWLNGDIVRLLAERNIELENTLLTATNFAKMIILIDTNKISNTAGKIVMEEILFTNTTPDEVVAEKGLLQLSDASALQTIVSDIVSGNPKAIEDYKNGKTNVVGFLVGQCMKASKGKGNPEMLKTMVLELLDK